MAQLYLDSANSFHKKARSESSQFLFFLSVDPRFLAEPPLSPSFHPQSFHRSLKEEEVWPAEYRNVQEARGGIARWIE